jgi:hypothetical protein
MVVYVCNICFCERRYPFGSGEGCSCARLFLFYCAAVMIGIRLPVCKIVEGMQYTVLFSG